MRDENLRMKEINKELLKQLQAATKEKRRTSDAEAFKVHSLYQELYVADLKKEIAEAETGLKASKAMLAEAKMDVSELKR